MSSQTFWCSGSIVMLFTIPLFDNKCEKDVSGKGTGDMYSVLQAITFLNSLLCAQGVPHSRDLHFWEYIIFSESEIISGRDIPKLYED